MNMQKLAEFFIKEIEPDQIATELDEIIFDFIYVYGSSDGSLSVNHFGKDIFLLKQLRDILKEIAKKKGSLPGCFFFIQLLYSELPVPLLCFFVYPPATTYCMLFYIFHSFSTLLLFAGLYELVE